MQYDAHKFLHYLDPSATEFNFHTGPDTRDTNAEFKLHHGNLNSIESQLDNRNALRNRVSVQVNESRSESHLAKDIVRVRAIWCEDDGQGEGVALPPLRPSLIVQSSPGRYHRYWFVEGTWSADEQGRKDFADCMKAMVEIYGSDPNAKDISRSLRLAGTNNWKYGQPQLVTIIYPQSGEPIQRYSRRQLVEAFAKALPPSPIKLESDTPDYEPADLDAIRTALKAIPSDDREKTWLKVGMGLHHEFGDAGYDLWTEWSKTSNKYEEADQLRTWKSFSEDRTNPITIASLFAIANAYGWNEPSFQKEELDTTRVEIPRYTNDLTERTMAGLRQTFEGRNHRPSDEQMDGLEQAAIVIQGMADGTLPNHDLYVSFLAPGIGKTSTVIEALRNMGDYHGIGVIIFLARIEEIRKLVVEMELKDHEFSVLCSDRFPEYRLGNQNKCEARVMFTTQQQLQIQSKHVSSFANIGDFQWNGRTRQVRIWDEAILPTRSITVKDHDIIDLFKPITLNGSREFADMTLKCGNDLKTKKDKGQIEIPDFKATAYALQTVLSWFDEGSEEAATMEALWRMSGLTLRVRKEMGTESLHYEEQLPSDLGPMLILDASGKTRKAYKLWAKHREGLRFLNSPEKTYEGLTINFCEHASGRNTRRNQTDFFVKAFSDAIGSLRENESILAIVHKPKNKHDPDFATLIGERSSRSNLNFLTYGNHTATNDYAHCKHVMLVGVMNYSMGTNEAIGRGVMGLKTEDELSDEDYHDIRLGEISHHIYQAACRGQVRRSEGGHCPQGTTLWVTYPTKGKHGIPVSLLTELFPGATINDWNPSGEIKLPKHAPKLIEMSKHEWFRRLTVKEKAKRLDMDPSNLSKLVRNPEVSKALAAARQ